MHSDQRLGKLCSGADLLGKPCKTGTLGPVSSSSRPPVGLGYSGIGRGKADVGITQGQTVSLTTPSHTRLARPTATPADDIGVGCIHRVEAERRKTHGETGVGRAVDTAADARNQR